MAPFPALQGGQTGAGGGFGGGLDVQGDGQVVGPLDLGQVVRQGHGADGQLDADGRRVQVDLIFLAVALVAGGLAGLAQGGDHAAFHAPDNEDRTKPAWRRWGIGLGT